jgi:tRNA (cytidine32/guanosine34-2'-O)-methyltransferase
MQAKIFRGSSIALLYSQLQLLFPDVTVVKPRSSRNSSIEAFVVCKRYTPPPGFMPEHLAALLDTHLGGPGALADTYAARVAVPFLACGSLEAWDSDMTYDLPEDVEGSGKAAPSLDPVQPPLAPHYQAALQREQRSLR